MASDNTERYRQAAETAIQQLDWCIRYLREIGKGQIAARVAENRDFIKRNLMRED